MRHLHEEDLRLGLGRAALRDALARKYPHADRQWGWQLVFPAASHYSDCRTGIRHRHRLHESVVQKEMALAVRHAGLTKLATPHTLSGFLCGTVCHWDRFRDSRQVFLAARRGFGPRLEQVIPVLDTPPG